MDIRERVINQTAVAYWQFAADGALYIARKRIAEFDGTDLASFMLDDPAVNKAATQFCDAVQHMHAIAPATAMATIQRTAPVIRNWGAVRGPLDCAIKHLGTFVNIHFSQRAREAQVKNALAPIAGMFPAPAVC